MQGADRAVIGRYYLKGGGGSDKGRGGRGRVIQRKAIKV
jgi:hypothetical protein